MRKLTLYSLEFHQGIMSSGDQENIPHSESRPPLWMPQNLLYPLTDFNLIQEAFNRRWAFSTVAQILWEPHIYCVHLSVLLLSQLLANSHSARKQVMGQILESLSPIRETIRVLN